MNKITAFFANIFTVLTQKRVQREIPIGYKSKATRYVAMLCAVVFCLAVAFTYHAAFANADGYNEDIAYPLEGNVKSYNPYVQQFDAFQKKQMHLDFEPSKKLLSLENPYDYDARYKAKVSSEAWDRALYDGKFYSYFGVTPIITVIYPAYTFTGMIPADTTIQLVFMLIFAIFMPLAVYAIGEKIAKRTNPFIIALVSGVATISSFQFLLARGRTPFYFIAATSAMAFLAMFAFLFVKGMFSNKSLARRLYFLGAGLAFALCMHARINTAFTAAFAIVPAVLFGIILKKRNSVEEVCEGQKLSFFKKYRVCDIVCELCALGLFVVIGMIAIFWLNQAKFGNILDFGTSYQLTVADVSTYKLDIAEIPHSIFHYFLAPLRTDSQTGALDIARWSLATPSGRYVYTDVHFGLLVIPFNIFAFALPFVFADKKRNISFKVIVACAFVGCFASAWIDYCLGGVIYRYLCDFSVIWAMLAAAGMFVIFDALSGTRLIIDIAFTAILIIIMLSSASFTFSIMSITNSNANVLDMHEESFFYKTFGPKNIETLPS